MFLEGWGLERGGGGGGSGSVCFFFLHLCIRGVYLTIVVRVCTSSFISWPFVAFFPFDSEVFLRQGGRKIVLEYFCMDEEEEAWCFLFVFFLSR